MKFLITRKSETYTYYEIEAESYGAAIDIIEAQTPEWLEHNQASSSSFNNKGIINVKRIDND